MLNEEQRKRHWGSPHHNQTEENYSIRRYSICTEYVPDVYENKFVVDMGCGWGGGTRWIATHGKAKKVIGLDVNQEVLDLANKEYLTDNTEYRNALIFDTGLEDESVDTINAVEVVEHVDFEELDLSFKEFYRILKKGGYLHISTPELRGNREDFPKGSHFMEYEFDELRGKVSDYGFELIGAKRKGKWDSVSMSLLFKKV